ncbi:hypothetical protein PoB_000734300 [Plakobranchus ocellatus]|uniref:Uncharacterized protein n=1 Tax=Plakobranchus ocellatus TaxID=259542 RepID=A0AAV3YED8_9GAST|nr:hypothetical protein PoB_000734300 [Plakobranchus ocellatus]
MLIIRVKKSVLLEIRVRKALLLEIKVKRVLLLEIRVRKVFLLDIKVKRVLLLEIRVRSGYAGDHQECVIADDQSQEGDDAYDQSQSSWCCRPKSGTEEVVFVGDQSERGCCCWRLESEKMLL